MSLRRCLREPIPEIEQAAWRMNEAVSAHLRGDRETAEGLFRLADDRAVWNWLNSLWGKKSPYNQPRVIPGIPMPIPMSERAKPRDATMGTKLLVHRRDGYYCRFCKIPVIRSSVRNAIGREYPHLVRWELSDVNKHAGLVCMWAQHDHVIPHAHGGTSDPENVVLTCAGCNYGRGAYTLAEFDLLHPDSHEPRRGPWDGLERFVSRSQAA